MKWPIIVALFAVGIFFWFLAYWIGGRELAHAVAAVAGTALAVLTIGILKEW